MIVNRQANLLKRWNSSGTDVIQLDPKWHTRPQETFPEKKSRLENDIKKLLPKYKNVSIFGSSAGGSMALNIFDSMHTHITSCILIAGKLKGADYIGSSYRRRTPALYDCVKLSQQIAEYPSKSIRSRILTIRPLFDETVPVRHALVYGAKNRRQFLVGHFISIGYSLLFQKRVFIKWHRKFSK